MLYNLSIKPVNIFDNLCNIRKHLLKILSGKIKIDLINIILERLDTQNKINELYSSKDKIILAIRQGYLKLYSFK